VKSNLEALRGAPKTSVRHLRVNSRAPHVIPRIGKDRRAIDRTVRRIPAERDIRQALGAIRLFQEAIEIAGISRRGILSDVQKLKIGMLVELDVSRLDDARGNRRKRDRDGKRLPRKGGWARICLGDRPQKTLFPKNTS